MDARRCIPLARTTLGVIACVLAVPTAAARAEGASETPPAPVDGAVEQAPPEAPERSVAMPEQTDPAAGGQAAVPLSQEPSAEPSEPVAEPSEPVAEPSEPVAEPSEPVAEPSEPVAEPSNPVAEPSQPVADASEPTVAEQPAPGTSHPAPDTSRAAPDTSHPSADPPDDRSNPRRPRAHGGVLLRHVNKGIRDVNRELAAGQVPSEGSLRELRQNVEELVPTVDALERHRATGQSVPGGRARFERGLRRALAGAVVLVAALVRSDADTTESERLLGLLRRFAGISPGARGPDRPGAAHAAPGAAVHRAAYTQAAARLRRFRSRSPGNARRSVAIAPQPAAELSSGPFSPARIARLTPAAPGGGSSSAWLAAVALLLAVAASGSFTSMIMSRWGLRPMGFLPRPRLDGRRQGIDGAPSRRRRTSTIA